MSALWILKWDYSLEAIMPVVKELRKRGYEIHMVLTEYNDALLANLKEEGVKYYLQDENALRNCGSRLFKLLQLTEWRACVKARRVMDSLYEKIQPDLIFSTGETRLFARPLIKRGNQKGVPTVDVGWSFSNPQEDYDQQRLDLVKRFGDDVVDTAFIFQFRPKTGKINRRRGAIGMIKRKIAARPKFARLCRHVLRASHWPLHAISGTNYRIKGRGMGRGEARVLTCLGPAFVDQFVSQGIPTNKLFVAGLPEHDILFSLTPEVIAEHRRKICSRFSFDSNQLLVFWAPRASAEDGYQEDLVQAQERAIADALLAQNENLQIVCKLHPRTNLKRFSSWMPKSKRLAITLEADKVELLAACEVFVSTYSTVVLSALALDKEIFTYNVLRIPGGDVFKKRVGGVAHACSIGEIAPNIKALFSDPATKQRLVSERDLARETHMVFDGQVAHRIVELAESLSTKL
ncbi:hypothetical protein N9A82_00135 [Akkermansiaceae bacterium]|nr:hypothetical protein [Akkermansiaceae bacterium]